MLFTDYKNIFRIYDWLQRSREFSFNPVFHHWNFPSSFMYEIILGFSVYFVPSPCGLGHHYNIIMEVDILFKHYINFISFSLPRKSLRI